jgi:uncharacterized protein
MYPRYIESLLLEFITEFRVIYLTGPRQAGKTTVTRSLAAALDMEYMTLDNQAVLASVQSDPFGFIQALGNKKIVLDEFQYVADLIPAIKAASDALPADVKGKFILTGSADIFRSAKSAEALPGHMARFELYPLSMTEINHTQHNIIDYLIEGDFHTKSLPVLPREQLLQMLLNGGYPEIQTKSSKAKRVWFKSYLEGRLFKDFETLYAARGDYHSKLKALVSYLAGLSGNLLRYAKVANDLGFDDKSAKHYIEILELMFIIKRMPGYLKNKSKREAITMPKLQMVDTGLACYLLGLNTEPQVLASSHYGGLLENFIFMECIKQATWAKEEVNFYHFRDTRQQEVDIILEQANGKVIAVEVKAAATVNLNDFKGLYHFALFAGLKFERGVLFYSGQVVLPFVYEEYTFYALPIGLITGTLPSN